MLSRKQGGLALIEGLVAILIFSLGMLGLIGLQAASTQSTVMAKARIEASFLAAQRIATVWGDVDNVAAMVGGTEDVSAFLPEGKRITAFAKQGDAYDVKVTVNWKIAGDTAVQSYTTVTRVATN